MQTTLSEGLIDKNELVRSIIKPTRRRKRFLNNFLDGIFIYLIYSVIEFILSSINLLSTEATPDTIIKSALIGLFINITFMIIYYTFFEYKFGKTIGKMATNTKVVRKDGSKPTLENVIGRSFARLIPFEPLSMLFTHLPVGWHDSLTNTMVVDDISLYNLEKIKEVTEESF